MSLHPFLQRLAEHGLYEPQSPKPVKTLDIPEVKPGDPSAERYVNAALESECERVRTAPEGQRNHTLNIAAFNVGTLVQGGYLNADIALDAIRDAARSAGLGDAEIDRTAPRAMQDASKSPRTVRLDPPPEVKAAYVLANNDDVDDETSEAALDEAHRGHARMAYRLARVYKGRLLHVTGLGWHVWDGHRWIRDEDGASKRAVLDTLRRALAESIDDKDLRLDVRKCESSAGINGVLDIAAALEPMSASVPNLDADPYLLNVANGTLDLRTMTLRAHDPADRITKVCRAAYTPGAKSDKWVSFLDRVLPDEQVREFVQRLVGVGLLGLVVEHILPIFTGTGANGKSVFDKAIRHALGDYASTAEPDLFMQRAGAHPTGEMDLLGIRWCAVSESEKGRRLAEATMKRLTGGDTIRARRMRQDFVEFTPSHTAVLITNHLPTVSGDDKAIWRRIRVVPFNVVIPPDERDPHLDEKLQLDAEAVLSWAVHGYSDYLAKGGLAEPESVKAATDTYQVDSDAVARFLAERCIVNPSMYGTPSEFHASWTSWAVDDGSEQLSLKALTQALAEKGFKVHKSNGRRLVRGIGLLSLDDDDD